MAPQGVDAAHGVSAIAVTLKAIADNDAGGLLPGVGLRQPGNRITGDPGHPGRPFGCEVLDRLPKALKAAHPFFYELGIVPAVCDDRMRQTQRQGAVGGGAHREVVIGKFGRSRSARVDKNDRGT